MSGIGIESHDMKKACIAGFILISAIILLLFSGCSSAASIVTDNTEPCGKASLRYPVILAHGIFAHDRKSVIDFWGNIPERLRENHILVFLGNTDAWGDYESNAEKLKETVDSVLSETHSEKVNIIAHSKGGLDARYMIWKYDYGDKVASLTTISTPHHGAEISDLIDQRKIVHNATVQKLLDVFGKLYGDANPHLFNLNHQLTTEEMKKFNELVGMDSRVYYQSYYTTLRSPFDDMMFFYSYLYIKHINGNNDGVVSEYSATWGDNVRRIDGKISHAEIVDYKKRKIHGIDIPGIYLQITDQLCNMGF